MRVDWRPDEGWEDVKLHFTRAADLDQHARERYVAALDPGLREEVSSLLEQLAEASRDDFLSPPRFGSLSRMCTTTSVESSPRAESEELPTLERYRLLRRIGEGGMGTVYLAERTDGVFEQQVAVKFLQRAVDRPEFRERFDQERRTLARLEHPNIARILDGGALPDGSPYLVLEYVQGTPIDSFCDQHELGVRERLLLFTKVLGAVQYAHQQLVIHRDLKPANILINKYGEPKLLDFGISRVLRGAPAPGSRDLDCPYTLEYASPEQIRGQAVATSTDIYSLGVVLYQLLAESAPYQLDTKWRPEVERIICEEEPVPPSTAVRRANATSAKASLSAARELQGDVDSIVLRALEKDAQNRFTSAEQFATDIQRHLCGLPVVSRPSTFRYRSSCLIRRHSYWFLTGIVVVGILAAAGVMMVRDARIVAKERDRAVAAQTRLELSNQFLEELLQSPDPAHDGEEVTVVEILDRAASRIHDLASEDPDVAASLLTTIGRSYFSLGSYDSALQHFRQALDLRERHQSSRPEQIAWALNNVGTVYYTIGEVELACQLFEESLELQRGALGEQHLDVAQALNNLASVYRVMGRIEASTDLAEQALEIRRALAPNSLELSESLNNVANRRRQAGELEAAERLLLESLEIRRQLLAEHHPLYIQSLGNLATLKMGRGDFVGAEPLLQQAVALAEAHLGPSHPDVAFPLYNLAQVRERSGGTQESVKMLERVLEIRTAALPEGHRLIEVVRERLERLRELGACEVGQ